MDHHYIEEHNVADRYLLGKLPAEERTRFEEHFVVCAECLDRVEMTEGFRGALRAVAAEEAARPRVYAQAGLLARLVRLSPPWQLSLAAAAILLLAVPSVLLFRARHQLDQVRQAYNDLQGRPQTSQQPAPDPANDLRAIEQRAAEQRRQLEIQLEQERQARARLDEEIQRLRRPQASVPVFALSIVRGAGSPPSQIAISRSSQRIILSLEVEANPDLQSYRATLINSGQQVIWRAADLKPNSRDALRLGFNASLFISDNYLLTLEGLTLQGRYISIAKYPFRVVRQ